MDCNEARKQIGFWMDKDLPEDEAMDLEHHLANCEKCSLEVDSLKCVSGVLDSYFAEPAPPPPHLKKKIMADFKKAHPKPNILEHLIFKQFSWPLIPIPLAGAVVGLFLGALVCEITVFASDFFVQDTYIDALCSTGTVFGL